MNTVTDNLPVHTCFIAPKAYPLFNPDAKGVFGGSEVDLYFLATELAKDENFAVSFVTADYGQKKTEVIQNVKIIKKVQLKFGGRCELLGPKYILRKQPPGAHFWWPCFVNCTKA